MGREQEYLGEQDVANIIGVSVQTLRNDRCSKRRIPYVKFGRSVRYRYSDVIAFMEAHKIKTRAA